MKQTVLIADDHKIFREGLRALLETENEIQVLGEAEDGRELVKMVRQHEPDMVIIDVAMPNMNGIEAATQIKNINQDIKVLALSMHSDSRFVRRMLQAGANGYLLKDCAFDELTLAMQTIEKDQVYLSPGVSDLVVKDYLKHVSNSTELTKDSALSSREREVLQLMAEGKTTADIANTLNISGKTVETHRRRIMEKLDLHSVAELTQYAIREGIIILKE